MLLAVIISHIGTHALCHPRRSSYGHEKNASRKAMAKRNARRTTYRPLLLVACSERIAHSVICTRPQLLPCNRIVNSGKELPSEATMQPLGVRHDAWHVAPACRPRVRWRTARCAGEPHAGASPACRTARSGAWGNAMRHTSGTSPSPPARARHARALPTHGVAAGAAARGMLASGTRSPSPASVRHAHIATRRATRQARMRQAAWERAGPKPRMRAAAVPQSRRGTRPACMRQALRDAHACARRQ